MHFWGEGRKSSLESGPWERHVTSVCAHVRVNTVYTSVYVCDCVCVYTSMVMCEGADVCACV